MVPEGSKKVEGAARFNTPESLKDRRRLRVGSRAHSSAFRFVGLAGWHVGCGYSLIELPGMGRFVLESSPLTLACLGV